MKLLTKLIQLSKSLIKLIKRLKKSLIQFIKSIVCLLRALFRALLSLKEPWIVPVRSLEGTSIRGSTLNTALTVHGWHAQDVLFFRGAEPCINNV